MWKSMPLEALGLFEFGFFGEPENAIKTLIIMFKKEQARVARLVARWLAVPEIRVQTPPGAN